MRPPGNQTAKRGQGMNFAAVAKFVACPRFAHRDITACCVSSDSNTPTHCPISIPTCWCQDASPVSTYRQRQDDSVGAILGALRPHHVTKLSLEPAASVARIRPVRRRPVAMQPGSLHL